MHKKSGKILIAVVVAVLAVLVVVFAFTMGKNGTTEKPGITDTSEDPNSPGDLLTEIYYLDTASSYLKAENLAIMGKTEEEILAAVIAKMSEKPQSEALASAIPATVTVQSVVADKGIATVDMSKSYLELKSGAEITCRGALVWTLTGLSFVDYVEITVDGAPLKDATGKAFGKLHRDDILIDSSIPTESSTLVVVKLYFANEDSTGLVAENREISAIPGQMEKAVVEQLISGPKEKGHYATVPPETKIRSVTVSDGICYVDLSNEFISKHNGGSTGEMLTIYSIVNSLTDLDTVGKVQFLIEGEKRDEFKGHVDFSQPFEAADINS